MCSATQAVKCGVASSSPSSLASVSLSFWSTCTILFFHIVVLILFVVILYQFIQLFTRSHFSHMCSLYSHGILGVVFYTMRRYPRVLCCGDASTIPWVPASARGSVAIPVVQASTHLFLVLVFSFDSILICPVVVDCFYTSSVHASHLFHSVQTHIFSRALDQAT